MICLILVAGYATRLFPLTENFPKPLLKIGNTTILDSLVTDIYKNCNIDNFVLVSNHRYLHHFQNWAEQMKGKTGTIQILDDYSTDNENRLGAVNDIQFALNNIGCDEDLLIIAGDNMLDFSLESFTLYYEKVRTSCIMRFWLEELKEDKKYSVCVIDSKDKVLEMREKVLNPPSHWLVPPFYIYKKEDLPLIEIALKSGCPADSPGYLVEWMCKHTVLHSLLMPGRRYDIGDKESYCEACRIFEKKFKVN